MRGIGWTICVRGKDFSGILMAQPIAGPSLGGSRRAADVMSSQTAKSTKESGKLDSNMGLGSGVVLRAIPTLASGSKGGRRGMGCILGPMGIDIRESS